MSKKRYVRLFGVFIIILFMVGAVYANDFNATLEKAKAGDAEAIAKQQWSQNEFVEKTKNISLNISE